MIVGVWVEIVDDFIVFVVYVKVGVILVVEVVVIGVGFLEVEIFLCVDVVFEKYVIVVIVFDDKDVGCVEDGSDDGVNFIE